MSLPSSTGPRYLLRWDHSRSLEVDRDVVVTPHRLGELSLGADERLIDLLDRFPRKHIFVHTMGNQPAHSNELLSGSIGDADGTTLISAVNRGRLMVTLRDANQYNKELAEITRRLCREIVECHVGLRADRPSADLVIASPSTMQYYCCDERPAIRWQIRGEQSVRVYPNTNQYIDPWSIESIVVDQRRLNLYFEPEFDLQAQIVELHQAQMLSLPYMTPYRVECGDQLNVWLQTRFDTRASYRQRNVFFANRLLRKFLPQYCCGQETSGPWATIRSGIARVSGLSDRATVASQSHKEPAFVVDPKTVGNSGTPGMPKQVINHSINGFGNEANATIMTPVVLEN